MLVQWVRDAPSIAPNTGDTGIAFYRNAGARRRRLSFHAALKAMTLRNITIALCACLPLGGCEWQQSTLAPGGPHAESVATLSWVMFIGAGLIFLLVMALTACACLAEAGRANWLGRRAVIIGGGIIFPVVTLTALLVYGLLLSRSLVMAGSPALRIEVVGEQWWWRVHYLDAAGAPQLATANEISDSGRASGRVCAQVQGRDSQLLGAEPGRQARHDPGPSELISASRRERPACTAASARNIAALSTR